MRVTARGKNLHHTAADVEEGDIEGAAAQVDHQHGGIAGVADAVRERRRDGLAKQLDARQASRKTRSLSGTPAHVDERDACLRTRWRTRAPTGPAHRCASLKYAGTVMTARLGSEPVARAAI